MPRKQERLDLRERVHQVQAVALGLGRLDRRREDVLVLGGRAGGGGGRRRRRWWWWLRCCVVPLLPRPLLHDLEPLLDDGEQHSVVVLLPRVEAVVVPGKEADPRQVGPVRVPGTGGGGAVLFLVAIDLLQMPAAVC